MLSEMSRRERGKDFVAFLHTLLIFDTVEKVFGQHGTVEATQKSASNLLRASFRSTIGRTQHLAAAVAQTFPAAAAARVSDSPTDASPIDGRRVARVAADANLLTQRFFIRAGIRGICVSPSKTVDRTGEN